MNAVILSCSSLEAYVRAAQEKEQTNYPIVFLDKKDHIEPQRMRERILAAERQLPADVDTVLVSMGFCGGSWDQVRFSRRAVIPRVDDCVSLMLQTTDDYCPNPKQGGHLYMMEMDPDDFNMAKLFQDVPDGIGDLTRDEVIDLMFGSYSTLDIVDTGLNDCYSEAYAEKAQESADAMHVGLDYVVGSNRLLEKLVGGRWDRQFLVAEPGHLIRHADFFE